MIDLKECRSERTQKKRQPFGGSSVDDEVRLGSVAMLE